MPRRKIQPVKGEFYHIIKRGIEGRKIFLDENDFIRFINSLLVFNSKDFVSWDSRSFWYRKSPDILTRSDYKPQESLVDIFAFCLMPNHFHLLVKQLSEKGIQIFMQKLGGYSQYFNRKYGRTGSLFQDRYKIIHIKNETQLKNNFTYIHTNPVFLVEPDWKKEWKVKNPSKAIQFLEEEYRWSSLWDYLDKKNFPQVISKDFFSELFNGRDGVKEEVESWVNFKGENSRI